MKWLNSCASAVTIVGVTAFMLLAWNLYLSYQALVLVFDFISGEDLSARWLGINCRHLLKRGSDEREQSRGIPV